MLLISIVIPVYNVEKYLVECIESVLLQVDLDVEIILIDDGSTDHSGSICDSYQKMYPEYIRVFHKANEGLLLTRRSGFKEANGEYILNIDSDDTSEPNQIKTLKDVIKRTNADVIIFNVNIFSGASKKVFFKNSFETENVTKEDVLKKYLQSYEIVSMCGKIYKKSCLNLGFDYSPYRKVQNGEDTLQSAEIFNNSEKIVYINKSLYNYRMGSGMTAKFDSNYFSSFCIVFEYVQGYKENWHLDKFDYLLAINVFASLGKAITQCRFATNLSFLEKRAYLQSLEKNNMVQNYSKHFKHIKCKLNINHQMLIMLLINKNYLTIVFLLDVKNILSGKFRR